MSEFRSITNYSDILSWVQNRRGVPVIVENTYPEQTLAFFFPDARSKELENSKRINWEDFFQFFEKHKLAFQYEDANEKNLNYRFVVNARLKRGLKIFDKKLY